MVTLTALAGLPLVVESDDVAALILDSIAANQIETGDNPIVVIAQKIISKAEGRAVSLNTIEAGDEAKAIAAESGKDARLVELILSESKTIVRQSGSRLITENKLGIIMANAGIDQSNIDAGQVLLLPVDPDASAANIGRQLSDALGTRVGVVIADSTGRPWRRGVMGIAIGVHGVPAVLDLKGNRDLYGRELVATEIGVADSIAAAANLLMGQGDEGTPVVVITGLDYDASSQRARDILRDKDSDLFR